MSLGNRSSLRSPKTIGITGGSGFLGINLVRYLLRKGFKLVVMDKSPFDYPEATEVDFIRGDIRDVEKVQSFVRRVDAVIHAAAALPLHSAQEIFSVDVEGTETVLSEAVDHGVKRFIHISTAAVYGLPKKLPTLETDPLGGVGAYAEAKKEAEQVAELFRDKIVVTVFRPRSFVGPERLGIFSLLFDWAASGCNFPILGSGENRYQHLDVDDFCEAIWLALVADPHRANQTFNVGAADFGTFKSDIQAVLSRAGFGKRTISIPGRFLVFFLRLLYRLKLSPVYPWALEGAMTDSYVSISRAEKILNFSPRYSNSDALVRNYDWYVKNKSQFDGAVGKSHRVVWGQGVLAIAKWFFRH